MRVRVVALDLDGTIAEYGVIHPQTHAALAAARAAGFVLVLVTGRILADVRVLLTGTDAFAAVVAEEGAALWFPAAGRTVVLGPPPAEPLLQRLRDLGLWARAGVSIVELDAKDAAAALTAIRELQLPLVLHFNCNRVMILPQAITKATGLRAATALMRVSLHDGLAIGDAENDHELLGACEIGIAVGWGSPALQRAADRVLPGTGPAQTAEFLRGLADGQPVAPAASRRQLLLGRDRDGTVASVPAIGSSLLVAGDPRSGKSWIAGLLCEQWIAQHYAVCLIDPEGDYPELEGLKGVVRLGGDDPPPSVSALERLLRHPDLSVIVDLSHLELPHKRHYVLELLPRLAALRAATGLPHRTVLDEAHHFLHGTDALGLLGGDLVHCVFVTYQARRLDPDLLTRIDRAVVTRATDAEEVAALHRAFVGCGACAPWQQELATLEVDEALLLPRPGEPARPRRLRIAPRLTRHVRHGRKYLDLQVPAQQAFHFVLPDGRRGPQARSLQQLVDTLGALPDPQLAGHVQRGDVSRWIDDVFQDGALASQVRAIEARWRRSGSSLDFGGAVIHAVHGRYGVVDDLLP